MQQAPSAAGRPAFSFEDLLGPLECVECGDVTGRREFGWVRAICGGYDLGPPELVVLCPECASREQLA